MVQSSNAVKNVNLSKSVSAYEAASYLGCSYPHIIHLIRKNKVRAQKIRKQWFVDLNDLEQAKATNLVTPRPRDGKIKTKNLSHVFSTPQQSSDGAVNQEHVEIRLSIPKEKYSLVNTALFGGSNKTLKQILEMKVDELFSKLQKQLESVDL
jgi:excisionase family DNA binding protein